ncbi:DUF1190 domain-containing protein [Aliamphritea hakodatensis]|uniref:DUF1190 domain-containing protein n=1 Tax=Aliamphritea hakodatensis TaxID=2895352 RepID=UPI0022FD8F05|nr:DUF1190 domain-containing protein [Aliamphritea hakodatensis]
MKRTQAINLQRMRKCLKPRLKPLAVAVSSVMLVSCSDVDVEVYESVAQCIAENPLMLQDCEAAYRHAQSESFRTGPKYQTEPACEDEFGDEQCIPYNVLNNQTWFMPIMAGFLFYNGNDWDNDDYISSPLYSSKSRRSRVFGKWTSADGIVYGPKRYGTITVDKSSFKLKPTTTRTLSRGGFGLSVASRSSRGG